VKVRIGVVDGDRVVEVEVEDTEAFREELTKSFEDAVSLLWFLDIKGRRYAIPRDKVAFVEFEADGTQKSVGFAPAG